MYEIYDNYVVLPINTDTITSYMVIKYCLLLETFDKNNLKNLHIRLCENHFFCLLSEFDYHVFLESLPRNHDVKQIFTLSEHI